ncbi:Amino acid ABC transporter substrate-binding protein [Streptococcus agalactiae]|nr:Amino acid ABC transporter substrate-binding protein [Streptococcus agalactiae]AUP30976.1 Amino acid ABC transporter substrate-binding protein [Streptococcus agalactiae]AUP37719.1 Amino acid ABC transporter substrate-binding protein [Streptococcus agalactiae]CCW41253.1 Amino acid ABC transporter, glutamine-binding protein/permease protein [Streptococcus agalactiae ILRI112]
MKKILLSLFTALLITFGGMTSIQADEYLRVGMEAAYAPFNWTQNDNTNGAVPIEGTDQYANGYDVQVAKKLAKKLNKKSCCCQNKMGRPCSSTNFWKTRYDYCRNESYRRT